MLGLLLAGNSKFSASFMTFRLEGREKTVTPRVILPSSQPDIEALEARNWPKMPCSPLLVPEGVVRITPSLAPPAAVALKTRQAISSFHSLEAS